ncbi:hypothetical protein BCR43DRAFT_497546 [Syncephalastrum racemosum]|uniref:BRCT domain-containing protein n=1 Tax=Syncephalastrum racemosum TaxID=13706 RepID=A0A1X2H2E3_SYNRA|nr:hypothetical protein BCR43DRAFT_497546 [Syncephalastrum racemosum]
MATITGELFEIKSTRNHIKPKGKPRKTLKRRRTPLHSLSQTSPQQEQQQDDEHEDKPETYQNQLPPEARHILDHIIVFIDPVLYNRTRLTNLAKAMGATVVSSLKASGLTHFVQAPTSSSLSTKPSLLSCSSASSASSPSNPSSFAPRAARTANQALEKGVRVVSSAWLLDCFDQQKRLPEVHYPYDRAEQRLIPKSTQREAPSSADPFGIPAEDSSSDIEDRPAEEEEEQSAPRRQRRRQQKQQQQGESTHDKQEDELRRRRREQRSEDIAKMLERLRQNQNKDNEPRELVFKPNVERPKQRDMLDITYGEQPF